MKKRTARLTAGRKNSALNATSGKALSLIIYYWGLSIFSSSISVNPRPLSLTIYLRYPLPRAQVYYRLLLCVLCVRLGRYKNAVSLSCFWALNFRYSNLFPELHGATDVRQMLRNCRISIFELRVWRNYIMRNTQYAVCNTRKKCRLTEIFLKFARLFV